MTYVPSTARCVIGVLLYTVGLLGCATEASLERDTSTGGLVTFPLETESDILESAGRRDALRIMDAKCRSGWRIVKEGEFQTAINAADEARRLQTGKDRIWGIQFVCK